MKELKQLCQNFQEMWENFNSMVHSCSYYGAKTFTPYEPSRFVYSFFFFNAMANYNWEESFKRGTPIMINSGGDLGKINRLCSFVVKNAEQDRLDEFKNAIWLTYNSIDIKEKAKKVLIDERITDDIRNDGVKGLLHIVEGNVSVSSLKKVLYFIYFVRCNVFHGSKNLAKAEEPQIIRIKAYADFLEVFNKFAVDTIKMHYEKLANNSIALDRDY